MKITDEQASAMRKAWEDTGRRAGVCTMEDAMRAAAAVLPEGDEPRTTSTDEEIAAIAACLASVDQLEHAAQSRVLGYVCERLGLRGPWSE